LHIENAYQNGYGEEHRQPAAFIFRRQILATFSIHICLLHDLIAGVNHSFIHAIRT
jgi:hypothetical protein